MKKQIRRALIVLNAYFQKKSCHSLRWILLLYLDCYIRNDNKPFRYKEKCLVGIEFCRKRQIQDSRLAGCFISEIMSILNIIFSCFGSTYFKLAQSQHQHWIIGLLAVQKSYFCCKTSY
jgi:hypothetical protein